MLTPVIDPALPEAVGPSFVDGETALPLVGETAPPLVGETAPRVVGVVVGGRATEVAGDLAVGVGLLTTGAGDEGAAAGGLETADDLHWLRGGVVTLQAPGRARARVWLIGIPRGLLVVLTIWQRQAALVLTTEARAVQQPGVGVVLLGPPCKKARHGAILTKEAVHD
jgi:hypothetical protein